MHSSLLLPSITFLNTASPPLSCQISVRGRDTKKSCGHWQSYCCYGEGPFRSSADSASADFVNSKHETPRHLLNLFGLSYIGSLLEPRRKTLNAIHTTSRGFYSLWGIGPFFSCSSITWTVRQASQTTHFLDCQLYPSLKLRLQQPLPELYFENIENFTKETKETRETTHFPQTAAGSFLQTDEAEELRQVVSTANLRRELWAIHRILSQHRNINHGMSGYVGICRDLIQSWVCF